MEDLHNIFIQVREASRDLSFCTDAQINEVLNAVAEATENNVDAILQANAIDLNRMSPDNPKYDRLKLTSERILGIADGIRQVANLPSPVGRVLEHRVRPNGMELKKVSVPFGVIGIVYEARPNVTLDVFALCFKSGNACLLKGGSDAEATNEMLNSIIRHTLQSKGMNPMLSTLLPSGHESTSQLLHARGWVDLLIPRGGRGLIDFVRKEATVPVIETGAGVCHTYFDEKADLAKGTALVLNAKTRRVSVCNALDCLLVDKKRIADLTELCKPLAEKHVVIYADSPAYEQLCSTYPADLLQNATTDSFGTEFLDYKMSIKTVDGVMEAVQHIATYGSGHSECIITEDEQTASYFTKAVDSACVYVNVPTSFTDGGEFGLGAEIGISTQKLHARGPMGLEELNTYKWIIEGNGQIRKP